MCAAVPLPRLYCDFNEGSDSDGYWLLMKDDERLDANLEVHGLREGDRVLLYQGEDDFEVEAVLNRGRTPYGDERWVAAPDWSTKRDLA